MSLLKPLTSWNIFSTRGSSVASTSDHFQSAVEGVAVFEEKELKIGNLLGTGHFCEVHEVTAIKLKKNRKFNNDENVIRKSKKEACKSNNRSTGYAVKFLKKSICESKQFDLAAKDIAKEVHLLTLCDHDNIVGIHGISSFTDDGLFIVMDRLQFTLGEKILEWKFHTKPATQHLIVKQQIDISLQIANALAYLHSQRIIYRDLKPENIGFATEENIQLFDFGLSRELPNTESDLYRMSFAGSPMYMAPEVFQGIYNTKADVYSWAVVVYEMLALEKPFSEKSNLQKHRHAVCELNARPALSVLSLVPESLKQLLKNSWCKQHAKRFTMEEVCSELHTILKDVGDKALISKAPKSKCLAGRAA